MTEPKSFVLGDLFKEDEKSMKSMWKKILIDLIEEEGNLEKVIKINQKRYTGDEKTLYIVGIMVGMKIGENQVKGDLMGYNTAISTGEEIG